MMPNTEAALAARSTPMPTREPWTFEVRSYKTIYDESAIARIKVGGDARPVTLKWGDGRSVECLRIRRNVPGGYIPCFISGPGLEDCRGMIRGAFAIHEVETDDGKMLIVTFDLRPEAEVTHRLTFVNRELLDVVEGEKYHRFPTPEPMLGVVLVVEGAESKVRMQGDAKFQEDGRKQPEGKPEQKPTVSAVGTDRRLEALFAEGFTVYSVHSRSLVLTKGNGSNKVTKSYRMKVGYVLDPSRMPPPPPESKKVEG